MQYVCHNNTKSYGCFHNLPLSVAHIQEEIVGDPRIGMFAIVTVINEEYFFTIQSLRCVQSSLAY